MEEDYGTLTLRKMLPSTSSICLSVIRPISKKISPSNRCGIFRTSSADLNGQSLDEILGRDKSLINGDDAETLFIVFNFAGLVQ